MSSRYGGKIVTDGLVLCLDAHDAKSYAGEPTSNVVTYTNLDTGWSKGYQSNIVYNDIEPPAGISSQVVGHTRGNNSGYWYSYGDYAPQDPSVEYVVSMYVKTLDSNFRIAFYTADNSEAGRYWSSYITVPNDGKWHRVVWDSFTNPSNSQSDSLSFNFSYNGAIGNASTKTWFCAPQMEAKSYATPFVDGTRSATNGWVDRSGNSNSGTLTNMVGTGASHYRDGQVIMPVSASYLDFDGSDDQVLISSLGSSYSNYSLEFWIAQNGTPDASRFYSWNAGGTFTVRYRTSPQRFDFHYNPLDASPPSTSVSGVTLSDTVNGIWHHVVITNNSSGGAIVYTDGVAGSTGEAAVAMGNYGHILGTGYAGIVPTKCKIASFKIYSKTLTAAEVLSNYNATKSRFS